MEEFYRCNINNNINPIKKIYNNGEMVKSEYLFINFCLRNAFCHKNIPIIIDHNFKEKYNVFTYCGSNFELFIENTLLDEIEYYKIFFQILFIHMFFVIHVNMIIKCFSHKNICIKVAPSDTKYNFLFSIINENNETNIYKFKTKYLVCFINFEETKPAVPELPIPNLHNHFNIANNHVLSNDEILYNPLNDLNGILDYLIRFDFFKNIVNEFTKNPGNYYEVIMNLLKIKQIYNFIEFKDENFSKFKNIKFTFDILMHYENVINRNNNVIGRPPIYPDRKMKHTAYRISKNNELTKEEKIEKLNSLKLKEQYVYYENEKLRVYYDSKKKSILVRTNVNLKKNLILERCPILYGNLFGQVLFNETVPLAYYFKKSKYNNCVMDEECIKTKKYIKKESFLKINDMNSEIELFDNTNEERPKFYEKKSKECRSKKTNIRGLIQRDKKKKKNENSFPAKRIVRKKTIPKKLKDYVL